MISNQPNPTLLLNLTATLLEAYEDQTEPPGSTQGNNRPVGHVILRLRLESLTPEPLSLQSVQVTIWDADQQHRLMTYEAGEIVLGGQQILEPGMHLTNQTGFQGTSQVKALVTYRLDQQVHQVESSLAPVVVNP